MFSGKEAANPAYPTQWALNPTAYQNVDSNSVDWAALAQQWIAMKEAVAIIAPPPPSIKPDTEEGEAPMDVENTDTNTESPGPPPGAEWNAATNSWGGNWNQWGWNWSGASDVDPKMVADPSIAMMDGFNVPPDNTGPMPGFTSGPTPTFQHGYWTAPQDQTNSRGSSRGRERRSKSKNQDHNKTTRNRVQREKLPGIPSVIEPVVMPPMPVPTIDAAKRRQLPAWIREGLEKMEREKQRAIEREEEKKAREIAEKEKKRQEEEELERMKAEAGGQPMLPAKSKFDTDSEGESDREKEISREAERLSEGSLEEDRRSREERDDPTPLVKKSKEEIMQEVMLNVRRSLTEILLEVTDSEIHMVSQEELARYNVAQASRLNAMKASKSKALAAIASGLGLGAYESSSDESAGEEEPYDVTDQQLQDLIRRKKGEFERTSREIEAEVRRAEQREAGDEPPAPLATPDRPRRSRSSATPPPAESDTPVKMAERRVSNDKRNNRRSSDKVDAARKLDTVPEEKPVRSNKRERTPSPPKVNNKTNQKESSSTTSDSEADSSSSSNESSAVSEPEVKLERQVSKKRKRRSTSSSDSQRKSKKEKHKKETHKADERNSYSKSKYDEHERSERTRSKKNSYYEKHKSSRSREYERGHKDKYRDESDDDRQRKRSKRSRSMSYESRSGRRRASRDRSEERSRRREKRSHDRDRSRDRSAREHDKYDRYERSRDDRRRSHSGSRARHRR